ncbi:MAG: DinB family protein [Bacteroidetes bacterium]|nr:DinB family protein [Bacteroidota bacterium]
MQLKNYLVETFEYNDFANKLVLNKIAELPDKTECIKLFSHLINCQYKWLDRIKIYPEISKLDWWEPVYPMEDLAEEWDKSLDAWIWFLDKKSEADLLQEVIWMGIGNAPYTAQLKDIPLQLNYHSIHHRAQMQMLIRQQGLVPDFVDYIGTKYRPV